MGDVVSEEALSNRVRVKELGWEKNLYCQSDRIENQPITQTQTVSK